MAKERTTRRQKDVSRLLRERKKLRKDRVGKGKGRPEELRKNKG